MQHSDNKMDELKHTVAALGGGVKKRLPAEYYVAGS
jgi:hypothetical protein